MKIFIASDHGGFEVKRALSNELRASSYEDLTDLGPFEYNQDDDYPDYAFKVATAVANDTDSLGILICRSGNGMCIAANKVKGAYAALAFTVKHAQKARNDDNANIICLDADYEGEDPFEIVQAFLNAKFEGGRHERRFQKIKSFELS